MLTHAFIVAALFCAAVSLSCSPSRPMAHLIINNESGTAIPISLSIARVNETAGAITISNIIKPGLQELPAGRFAKGAYLVTASANNGLISINKTLSFDADRWIIINYTHDDSLSIQKKYSYVDTSLLKKVNGKYTGLDMYIENRRPPSL